MVDIERAVVGIQLSIIGLFLLQLFEGATSVWVSILLVGVGTVLVLNSMTREEHPRSHTK